MLRTIYQRFFNMLAVKFVREQLELKIQVEEIPKFILRNPCCTHRLCVASLRVGRGVSPQRFQEILAFWREEQQLAQQRNNEQLEMIISDYWSMNQ